MAAKIGLVTIGQAPRVDLTPDLMELWQGRIILVEKGALDDLTKEEIIALQPQENETVLVSRLRDGGCARLGEERIIPFVQQKITALQQEVDSIFLLCTGEFPPMDSEVPLIEPDSVLRSTMRGIIKPGQRLGVIVPESDQRDDIIKRWAKHINNEVIADFGTPYGEENTELLEAAAIRLKQADVDYIVLDCLGYSLEMKNKVKEITGKPVIIPRTLVARIIEELA